jgi:hypothetical protein
VLFRSIRKTAEKNAYAEGDVANYTILFGNELSIEAKDAMINDLLPDAEYLHASPSPSSIRGRLLTWDIGTLSPKSSGSISLSMKIKEKSEVKFQDDQSISGSGFVLARLRLNTSRQARTLVNHANITASVQGNTMRASSFASVDLKSAPGVGIETARHGSGQFRADQQIDYSTRNGIRMQSNLQSSQHPVNVSLVRENLTLNSAWSDRVRAENNYREEMLRESYLYMDQIDRQSSLLLDTNQTVFSSRAAMGSGIAQMTYRRSAGESSTDISERYHGRFLMGRHLDSYGCAVSYASSASGQGFAFAAKRAASSGSDQTSYEHGSGLYRSSELFASFPLVQKNVSMDYAPQFQAAGSMRINYSGLWSAGLSTRSRSGSELRAAIGQASYLRQEALMDSSSLALIEEFEGTASTRAVLATRGADAMPDAMLDQILTGKYTLDQAMSFYGLPRHLGPHLQLTKKLLFKELDMLAFRIHVSAPV